MALYFLCGLPRSGKSTISKQWVKFQIDISYIDGKIYPGYYFYQVQHGGNPRIVICGDALRLALHGKVYARESEGYIACMMEVMARAYLSEGYDVLIDETNTSVASITRWYRISNQVTPIWIDTNEQTCIKRAIALKQEYLIPVIKRCAKQKQYLKENWDQIKIDILDYLKEHN